MKDTAKYLHFIPDKPTGRDCFDGHSQERLAHSVCDYVRRIDVLSTSEGEADTSMPRIIGLEGGWGSGKSNVVRMIERELAKEGYYTFTYDAWGHQEDLQRRSILEAMTSHLIDKQVLQGKVKIRMRTGKVNDDTWKNQLSLLLSNKTTTIRKSTPKLTAAAFWGIGIVALFAFCSLVASQLINNADTFNCYWWIDIIPIALAVIVAICYYIKDGGFESIFRMVDHTNNDTIDEEYTSSEEPSVAEFKNWMRAMSDYLGSTKQKFNRLVIVFDNMDRLPSEKVMQLWSSIYTFFAGGEFTNIWTVIPYDYKHLCQAVYGNNESDNAKEKDAERIKQFISKTFPITYNVPEPVITDYKKLFYTYFDRAFGADEHDREHICQVFTHLKVIPNPRTVIRFVNELVAMRLQWNEEKYRLQNLALYVLKKDYLFYSGVSLDAQLLSDRLFDKIDAFYPDKEKVRTELCQYAYGLKDEKLASELPLRNELKRKVTAGESITEYVGKPNFQTVFVDLLNDTDQASLNNTVKSMASLDEAELTPEMKGQLQSKWDFLTNMKADTVYDSLTYDTTLTTLIRHASPKRVVHMAKKYAAAMQKLTVSDGVVFFQVQQKLQDELNEAKVKFEDDNWYQTKVCKPEQFVEYVCAAKAEYKHFGLTANIKLLNEYLLNGCNSGNSQVATVVGYIKDDEDYDLTDLKTGLAKAIVADSIKQNICVAAYVHRVLTDEEGVMKMRFKPETVAAYLNGDQSPWVEKLPVGLEDVIAMSLADGKDLSEIDDSMLPKICECMDNYFIYTDLLKHTGKEGSAYRKLNVYCVENLKGGPFDTHYAAQHLVELQKALGQEQAQLLKQFNQCPVIKWGEIKADNQYVNDVKNYVHQSFFEAYRDNPGNFSDSLIKLGVESLELQNTGFLAKPQLVQYNRVTTLVIDNYWKSFVETYLGTRYMPQAGVLLTNEAVTMLQWLYDHDEVTDAGLLGMVLKHADETTLKSYLHTMMNDHIARTDITTAKFLWFGKLLPLLGADMDQNAARGLIKHFIKPIIKDVECAAVIVEHKAFYLAVMQKDVVIAAPIVKEMASVEAYCDIEAELKAMVKEEKKGIE